MKEQFDTCDSAVYIVTHYSTMTDVSRGDTLILSISMNSKSSIDSGTSLQYKAVYMCF